MAAFKIADTPAGDAALDDIESGRRVHLSAEVSGVKIKNGKGIAGTLFAAALVEKPAFPSATLLAAEDTSDDDPDGAADDEPETTHSETEYVDEDGNVWRMVVDTETETDGDTTTTTTTVVEEVTENPEDPDTEEDNPMTATLAAKTGTPAPPRARTKQRPTAPTGPDLPTLYASIAAARAGDQQALTLLASLTDTKISGAGSLPGTGVLQESWIGQLWQGKSYDRKYINLGTLGTDISAAGKSGFKMNRGTKNSPAEKLGGDWTGNKTEISSGTANAEKFGSTLARWAFAGDIAREFFDLPGGAELIEAMFRLVAEDYAIWSDEKALATFVDLGGSPVAPKTYPADYSDSLGMLLQAILAVKRGGDDPTFAIVNSTAYEQLLYTPKDKIPEFVTFDFTTELRGTADASKVVVVEAADESFVDSSSEPLIEAGTPAVLAGAKQGVQFDELGEVPFTIDALEIAKGGVDRATHGYLQTFKIRPESFVLVGEAPDLQG